LRQSIFKAAVEEAEKSSHQQRIAAVIFDKKSILSIAHNIAIGVKKKIHPRFKRFPRSLHAEAIAIHSAKRDLKGSSIFVVRINGLGDPRMSKPCQWCLSYISYVGIKTIYYTNEIGIICKMRLRQIGR
jgi:tRNA(Arg) A34 adenosine deaminase TadA